MRVINHQGHLEEEVGPFVVREVLATFWQDVFASLTLGDIGKVPCIRHDHQKQEWEAIGRVWLSPLFLAFRIHGKETVTEEELLQSFKLYIPADEREVFDRCLSEDFESNDEDVLDFLSSYKCFRKPTPQNIKVIFIELAHQEIIQKPRYIAECWAPVLSILKEHISFSKVEGIRKLCLDSKPTAKKVIKSLVATPKNEAERESLGFLKKFIKSLDAVSLKVFLKFVTGSDVLIQKNISLSFNSVAGIARAPVAHTCGSCLELPSTYQSYNELAEDFTKILREKESWTFNIV